jgi:hypothetical protein
VRSSLEWAQVRALVEMSWSIAVASDGRDLAARDRTAVGDQPAHGRQAGGE